LADLSAITVANAPVSYGAFELTVGIDPATPDGLHVLDEVASAGYAGIDLGPVGYLGSGPELADRLAARGLGLAGAYLELPHADADALEKVLPELDAMLDTFDAVAGRVPGPPPHPTIADAGAPQRRSRPGRAHADRSMGLDDDGWRRFAAGLSRVLSRCRDRGYEPTFHNETGTFVEAPWEVERVLELTDAQFCLDTGHFVVGGGDPVAGRRPGPPPPPNIADAGAPHRRAQPGRAHADRSFGLDDDGWRRFAAGLSRVLHRCRDRGYEPTFHNETGTFVEAPWEVERVLDLTDARFCLDTGHFVVGGGDPVAALRDFGSRINQVHLKDASREVVAAIVADGDPVEAVWTRDAFPRLGAGDVDVDALLAVLRDAGWSGWLVVEQDTLPTTAERFARAAEDQRANRAFLTARGL
jgi:sugar phosphate isomerase/epimerase